MEKHDKSCNKKIDSDNTQMMTTIINVKHKSWQELKINPLDAPCLQIIKESNWLLKSSFVFAMIEEDRFVLIVSMC